MQSLALKIERVLIAMTCSKDTCRLVFTWRLIFGSLLPKASLCSMLKSWSYLNKPKVSITLNCLFQVSTKWTLLVDLSIDQMECCSPLSAGQRGICRYLLLVSGSALRVHGAVCWLIDWQVSLMLLKFYS